MIFFKKKYKLSPHEIYELSDNGQAKVSSVTDVFRYISWVDNKNNVY